MSHIITIQDQEVPFKNLEALKRAAERMGGKLVQASTFKWFGEWVGDSPIPEHLFTSEELKRLHGMTKQEQCEYLTQWFGTCEYKLVFPQCSYEVGLKRYGEGWRPIIDWFSEGGLQKIFGLGAEAMTEKNPLLQYYLAECLKLDAESKGFEWTEEVQPSGRIDLEIITGKEW